MGVRVATVKTLFAKPSQASFVANIFATETSVKIAGTIGFYYKFAQEYRIYRLQQYILKLIHSAKFADILKTKEAQRETVLKKVFEHFQMTKTDPRFVEYVAKMSGGNAAPDGLFGAVGGRGDARRGGGGGDGGGGGPRRGGTPPRRVQNPNVVGDAAPAMEAMLAEQASLASALEQAANVHTDKAVRAKAARKRSALFAPTNEDGAAAGGEV
jgi:hypothetical protein